MTDNITINIRMSTAARFVIGGGAFTITPSTTIAQLKEIISTEEASGLCPAERQRLIHKGRILSDDKKTLRQYDILDSNQTIHLVKSSGNVQRPATGSTGQQTTNVNANAAPSPAPGNFMPPPSNNNSNAANPFANMMGAMGAGAGANGMPPMPPGMEQLMQNPEQMAAMMNSPMMQSIMNNPDFLRTMMESNPQMQQLMESNPELRHMLNDPELMRRSMEMMRDPASMQNMMRNQDLAMSQIENIPGGFSALRRMYEDVQAPMMDAMTGGNQSGSGSGSSTPRNSANQNSGAAGTAMPNPWASPSQQAPSAPTNTGATASPGMGGMANPWANMGAGASAGASAGAGAGANNTGGMPGMPGMPGFPNPNNMNIEQTIQMLENPVMNQMMNNLMSDPATMQSIINSNPMLQQMAQANPQMAQMLSNPELMRTMMNPAALRSMMQMQNAMQGSGLGSTFPGMGMGMETDMGAGIPGGVPPFNAGSPAGLDFSTLLNQMQTTSLGGGMNAGAGTTGSTGSAPVPPEQRFRIQLQSLNDMGFDDNRANIAALTQTHGNVNRAIDILFSNPPSAPAPAPTSSTSQTPPPAETGDTTNGSSGAPAEDANATPKNAADKKNE
jgi:ubiquilin